MRPVSGLSVAFAILACTAAIEITNGVVDEDHEAIVVEAFRNEPENSRRGRQLPLSPLNGMYPASTYPISSGTQMALCRSPTGMLTFCGGNYQWGGARVPQQYPGLYPGQPPLYPGWGQYPQPQPQPVQPQYPGWPPQIPPVPTHPPTQVQPEWPQQSTPAPVPPVPVAPDTEPVIVESPEENLPSGDQINPLYLLLQIQLLLLFPPHNNINFFPILLRNSVRSSLSSSHHCISQNL